MSDGAPALRVAGATRTFPNGTGIHDIGFTARDRAVTAVIGPNGAGKTVLFSIIAGLLPVQQGTVDLPRPGARVAYCPDVPQFESWLTAREIVETSLAISLGTPDSRAVSEALRVCGLGRALDRRAADFSRGMLQRLGIAAALVTDPDVLVLDEPNSALDPLGRADVRDIIAEQKRHRCILLSSHMLSEVEQLADHIVVIDRGRLVTQGSTEAILTDGIAPMWSIRLGGPARVTAAEVAAAVPEAHAEFASDTLCTVRFGSFECAAQGLRAVIGLLGAPLIEVTLQDRDLDASFARIVRNQESR